MVLATYFISTSSNTCRGIEKMKRRFEQYHVSGAKERNTKQGNPSIVYRGSVTLKSFEDYVYQILNDNRKKV